MAFVQSPLPQEQQNQFSPTGQTTPNPMGLLPPQATQTGGSSGQGGGSGSSSAPSVGTPTQFGSTASRLSDYLKANQDQVQGMANQVAGQIGSQYSGVKSGIDSAGQTFSGQVAAGYTPTDPTLLSQVQDNPVEAAKDPNAVSSFQKQLNDEYTGPTSFESSKPYAGVQKNVTDAVQQAQLLGSYPGLSGYLQNNIETNATPGQNTLDTVLLQGNQPAFQTVQDAAKPFQDLPGYLSNLSKSQNALVPQAQSAAQAAKAAATGAFNTATGGFKDQLNSEMSQATDSAKNFNTNYNDIIAKLSNTMPVGQDAGIGSLTPDEQAGLNINQSAIDQYAEANKVLGFYGQAPAPVAQLIASLGASSPMKLSSYLSGGNTATLPGGLESVATPEEFEKAQAFSTLGGQNYTSPLDLSRSAVAGTYQPGGHYQTFDTSGANGLFGQVSSRDKALADNFFQTNPNIPKGDLQAAIASLSADPGALKPGSGALYMLSALSRLAAGAPPPPTGGYVPTPTPPNSGTGVGGYTPPPQSGGGHYAR